MKESSIDSLVFDTLIPKPIIQRYLNLLMEHRRIILSGPSGTGKSFLAAKLAEYIISQMGQEMTEHNVASFNVDQNSSKVRWQIQNDSLGLWFDNNYSLVLMSSYISHNTQILMMCARRHYRNARKQNANLCPFPFIIVL